MLSLLHSFHFSRLIRLTLIPALSLGSMFLGLLTEYSKTFAIEVRNEIKAESSGRAMAAAVEPSSEPVSVDLPSPDPATIAVNESDQNQSNVPMGNDAVRNNVDFATPVSEDDTTAIPGVMGQLTSVSQLADVLPTDWALQALRSLVEQYGCVVGYPDGQFLGNQYVTRYEFAAAVNACADSISQILSASTENAVSQNDLAVLQRLQEDFAVEISTLKTQVDDLEDRTARLEANQFSTTTRLNGVATFSLVDTVSGEGDTQTTGQYTTYIGLATSFTGRDLLLSSIYASDADLPNYTALNDGRDVGSTREGLTTWAYGGSTGDDIISLSNEYIFPIFNNKRDRLYVTLAAENGFNTSRSLLPISGLTWEGVGLGYGPVSSFGQRSPIYRLGGGMGVITNYDNGPWRFTLGYLASEAPNPLSGAGLFNGNYLALTQLNFTPSPRFGLALAYRNNYFGAGEFAFNNQYAFQGADSPGFVGTGLANRFDNAGVFFDDNVPVVSNTYGLQGFFSVSPNFVIGGFVTKISARLLEHGDADIWTYALSLAFPDLGREGNLGGVIVGVEPMLTGLRVGNDFVGGFENDTSLHIEAFYQYRLSDNIAITPGVMWITAPNQDNSNEDLVVAVLRTTFSF